jgi:tRNA G46 methylase TrmB
MAYPPDKYAHVRLEGLTLKPDEPWFLLRGQDVLTPPTMEEYAVSLEEIGKLEMAADVRDHAQAVRAWQRANPQYVKQPD